MRENVNVHVKNTLLFIMIKAVFYEVFIVHIICRSAIPQILAKGRPVTNEKQAGINLTEPQNSLLNLVVPTDSFLIF